MFSNDNDFILLLGHQRMGEVKNKCKFVTVLGRFAEKRVTKRLEKVTKRGFFTVSIQSLLQFTRSCFNECEKKLRE